MRVSRTTRVAAVLAVVLVAVSCDATRGEPAATSSTSIDNNRPSVILDGDFGGDDMMAMLYLLGQPGLEVAAVTVSGTGLVHCPAGAANASAVLDHLERGDIPVACGGDTPLAGSNAFPEDWRSGSDALAESLGLEPFEGVVVDDAVDLLVDTITAARLPVDLLVLGPMTNVATALTQKPEIVGNIGRIVIMGGALDVSGSVAPDFEAEWNLWVDPAAARVVLDSGVPTTFVPLDATNHVPATKFFFETLGSAKETRAAKLVYRFFATHDFNLQGGTYFFWDPLAAVTMIEPEVVEVRTRRVQVDETTGALVETPEGTQVEVAVSADRQLFEEAFLSALNDGAPVVADIPAPQVTVRFDGDGCSFEGPTTFTADGRQTRIIAELVNETEIGMTVVTGYHDGISWEELVADVEEYRQTGVPPAYWVLTGSIDLNGKSVTGGRTVAPLDLRPGTHALVCANVDNELSPLADIVVVGS